MLLTQFVLQNATPRDKPYRLRDGNGLFLLVQPNGKKLWRFRYHLAGRENLLGFGSYPEITLASARKKRDEARTLIAERIDPGLKRKADKIAAADAARNTFGAIAAEYIENLKENGRAVTTMEKNRWLLNDLAKPLHGRPMREINAAEAASFAMPSSRSAPTAIRASRFAAHCSNRSSRIALRSPTRRSSAH